MSAGGHGSEVWSGLTDALPHDSAAELATIAALTIDNAQFPRLREIVGPNDFYSEPNRLTFSAAERLIAAKFGVDLITLRWELERTIRSGADGKSISDLERVGGAAYLAKFDQDYPRSINGEFYAQIVREMSLRRLMISTGHEFALAAGNGHSIEDLHATIASCVPTLQAKIDGLRPAERAVDLYDAAIVATRPAFTVANLIRKSGLHLVWAEPSAGKTWTLLRWVHELMLPRDAQRSKLTDHPELWITRRWQRVLWIATEEDGPTLRFKANQILRGLGVDALDGVLLYRFAASTRNRITLDDLPAIVDADGPLDAIVLDSLTGLRPKTVNGERVRWDVDNDAANEMCLRLRGLAAERELALFLVHHTGRDTSRGYRGPTDWWASADVMFGFVPDGGRTKVVVEKNRDGKRVAPFYLSPSWAADSYTLEYDGSGVAVKLTPTALKVLAWFQGAGQASQAQVLGVDPKLGGRTAVMDAIKALLAAGALRDTGNQVAGSPILAAVPEGAGLPTGTTEGEK